ncbi:hypothetical protein SAMN05216361_0030 [Marisediminitalea aggregata]|uniref:Uncharacterized protein n=1 Tax=Marisediminitalea aggregata TaxID=634436 RepID=A0A1M5SMA9_9ALTE|nr:hypothetical protein [Marisediminitalea aggregata]SHH39654.1 hypothetical protein SAMN05216361_0030 [Marisediminitalea aggregata]
MDDFESKVTQLFKENFSESEGSSSIPQSVTTSGTGNIVSIGTNHINVTNQEVIVKPNVMPGSHHITSEQQYVIRGLVDDIVKAEKVSKAKPRNHAAVWSALKRKFKFSSYKFIEQVKYPEVEIHLRQSLGRLRRAKSSRQSPSWRRSRYGFIYARLKELERVEDKEWYLEFNFGCSSLTELTDEQLQQTYDWVASLKK